MLQNEALNLGFECQRPDILGRADPAVRHGLMSPFIFITYFYPRAPSPCPASRNLEFGCGVRGGWAPRRLLRGGATPAGLCRGSAHFPKQCKPMGRCYEGSREPAKGGGNRLGVHGFLSASRVRTGSQRCAKLKTVSILGNARACLTPPSRTRSHPGSVPGHRGEDTWGHTALKGEGMRSLSQISRARTSQLSQK